MCEQCRQSPHSNRCPCFDGISKRCSLCDDLFDYSDFLYEIDGLTLCDGCFKDFVFDKYKSEIVDCLEVKRTLYEGEKE